MHAASASRSAATKAADESSCLTTRSSSLPQPRSTIVAPKCGGHCSKYMSVTPSLRLPSKPTATFSTRHSPHVPGVAPSTCSDRAQRNAGPSVGKAAATRPAQHTTT
eukprot:2404013-Pleurochrysis_carterae.AAC.2